MQVEVMAAVVGSMEALKATDNWSFRTCHVCSAESLYKILEDTYAVRAHDQFDHCVTADDSAYSVCRGSTPAGAERHLAQAGWQNQM